MLQKHNTTDSSVCTFFFFTIIALCCFSCQQTFWKFLKVKICFLLIFDLKTIIFPPDDAKLSKFLNDLICQIFAKVFAKNVIGGLTNMKFGVQSSRVGEIVEAAPSALTAIFSILSAYFNNFRQKIPYFDVSRQKRVLFNCFATKQCLGMLKM